MRHDELTLQGGKLKAISVPVYAADGLAKPGQIYASPNTLTTVDSNGDAQHVDFNTPVLKLNGRLTGAYPQLVQPTTPPPASVWNSAAGLTESTDVSPLIQTSGARSLYSDGTSNALWSTNAALLNNLKFGSGDFTIRIVLRPEDTGSSFRILEINGGNRIAWSDCLLWHSPGASPGKFLFQSTLSGTAADVSVPFGTLRYGIHTLLEIVRKGNTWYFFQDGKLEASVVKAGSIPVRNIGLAISMMFSDTFGTGTVSNRMKGYISGLEIYKGLGMFTQDHSPEYHH